MTILGGPRRRGNAGGVLGWIEEQFRAAAIRAEDPHAPVGAEGSMPGDLEKTISRLQAWAPYAFKRTNELLRSIAPPDLVRGNWRGGYVRSSASFGAREGTSLWSQLLGGAVNSSFFYTAAGGKVKLRFAGRPFRI